MKESSANHSLYSLRKLKVDCHYKKSTHFNAARRLKVTGERFRILLVVGSLAAFFSTVMNVGIWDKIEDNTIWIQVVVNILGAIGGFLILYATTFSDYKIKIETANKHENVANELNLIYKKIRNAEASFLDKIISDKELVDNLNHFTEEYNSKCQNAPITKDKDYLRAKENFNKGYTSEYTEDELKI